MIGVCPRLFRCLNLRQHASAKVSTVVELHFVFLLSASQIYFFELAINSVCSNEDILTFTC
jgi:hypothetical protein